MKKSTTLRSLVLCGLSMLLCVSMFVGSTFAWFTDEVQSGKNTIVAGNLDVELEYHKNGAWTTVGGQTDLFDPNALWEPGHTEVVYLKVSNAGNLALKYLLSLNIYEEVIGYTKNDEPIKLSDYILFGIVEVDAAGKYDGNRAAAIAAVTNPQRISEAISNQHEYASRKGTLYPEGTPSKDSEVTVALVVWMPTTVGNEANHGGRAPSITLGVNLYATQVEYEEDSFGNDYDAGAEFPMSGNGVVTVTKYPEGQVAYNVQVRNSVNGAKVGAVLVDKDSLDDPNKDIEVTFEKGTPDANIAINNGEKEVTYEITVSNLKEGNNIPVKVEMRLDTDLVIETMKLYHEGQPITEFTYNPETGYIKFETNSFSPFTVVYAAEEVYEPSTPDINDTTKIPVAKVEEYTPDGEITWGSYDPWAPNPDLEAELDAVYKFSCVDTYEQALASEYADWHCDFYVKLDKDLGENEIFLGGNYGSFGWVGFHNGDITLEANQEIGLLESVTTNPWTYADVVNFVGEFICGVGNVDDSLQGATFTVMLRLTNPDNSEEFINVSTITHTWDVVEAETETE